jgi:hypothetical protein
MHIHVFCVVSSRVGRGLAMCLFPIHGVLPKCLNKFTDSEVNSESKQFRGSNP